MHCRLVVVNLNLRLCIGKSVSPVYKICNVFMVLVSQFVIKMSSQGCLQLKATVKN